MIPSGTDWGIRNPALPEYYGDGSRKWVAAALWGTLPLCRDTRPANPALRS
jgi:hypothetical protein